MSRHTTSEILDTVIMTDQAQNSDNRRANEMSISKLERKFQLIEQAISSDIYNLGGQFFETIVTKLNDVLEADYTFVGELIENRKQIETISLVNKTGQIDNFVYDLEHTPCENVIGQTPCSYPKDVTSLFPKDQLLIDMGIEAYVGVPLYDSKKQPTGILVCLYKREIKEIDLIESILMIFASRASAELEHMKLYAALESHQQELEQKVDERTKELNVKNLELGSTNSKLSDALSELKSMQSQLIQSEKMASLGILTSGVAHEINNPLNYLMGAHLGLKSYFEKFESSEKAETDLWVDAIHVGIERISSIVQGLNQFSRNNENIDEVCNIHSILDNCFSMLNVQLNGQIEITKKYSKDEFQVKGNSGKLHQVFLNIITNSIQAIVDKGTVSATTYLSGERALIEISDNGKGMDESVLKKVLTPFFTTKSPGKGTGLGLSISFSIIEEHGGSIDIESKPNEGTKVLVTLPLNKESTDEEA
jgi:signal transduction histidine kinase